MIDPDAEIVEAQDSQTGASQLSSAPRPRLDRGRYQVVQTRKDAGSVLTIRADEAASFGLGHVVNDTATSSKTSTRSARMRSGSTGPAGSTRL